MAQPLKGYIHDTSPLKNGTKGSQYFRFNLQLENDTKKVICFSPSKRAHLLEQEENKTACKISKYKLSTLKSSDIVLNDDADIHHNDVPFQYEDTISPMCKLNEIGNITDFQEVCVQIKMTEVGDSQEVSYQSKKVKKRECSATDETGTVRFVVWEPHQVQKGNSYQVKVSVRSFLSKKYIQTTTNTTFIQIAPMDVPDEPTEEVFIKHITGNIASIEITSRHLKCKSCRRKILESSSSNVITCPSCHKSQLSRRCEREIVVKLQVENDDQNMYITCFADTVSSIVKDPLGLSDENLIENLLEAGENISFSYNPITNICKSIHL